MTIDPEQNVHRFIHGPLHEQILFDRYRDYRKLVTAVRNGDSKQARTYIENCLDAIHEVNRLYTPEEENMQQMRNRLISFNALLGFLCMESNAPVLFLHSLNRYFDKRIETVSTEEQCLAYTTEMLDEYCALILSVRDTQQYGEFSERVMELFSMHVGEQISLKQVAAQMGVAPETLSRKFHAETGKTISQARNEQRIKLAQLYIREDDMTLTQIAQRVGFSDASYFSKVFLRYTGMQPSAYQDVLRRKCEAAA